MAAQMSTPPIRAGEVSPEEIRNDDRARDVVSSDATSHDPSESPEPSSSVVVTPKPKGKAKASSTAHASPVTRSRRPNAAQKRASKGSTTTTPQYAFVVSSGAPATMDTADRTTIRRTVMKNFFHQRNTWSANGSKVNTSQMNSAEVVGNKGNLKGRWRLAGSSRQAATGTPSQSPENVEPWMSELSETGLAVGTHENSLHGQDWGNMEEWDQTAWFGGMTAGNHMLSPVKLSMSRFHKDQFDPFNVLPVPAGSRLDRLMHHYYCRYRINSNAINASGGWWSFVTQDAALFNIMLSAIALHAVQALNDEDYQVDMLWHKGHAIRSINEMIATQSPNASDKVVASVGTLANLENLTGNFDSARTHMGPFYKFVAIRGGIEAFRHSDALTRALIWNDFHHSVINGGKPSFPFILFDCPPLPEEFLSAAALRSPTSLLNLSLHGPELYNIFWRLHRLGLATSVEWTGRISRASIANLIYEVDHSIFEVPELHTASLTEVSRIDDFAILDSQRTSVAAAIKVAARIFLYKAFREIPLRAKMFGVLLQQLEEYLDLDDHGLVDIWTKEGNLHTLIWVLFVGTAGAMGGDWEHLGWFIRRLKNVVVIAGLDDRNSVENLLKEVAWCDMWFSSIFQEIFAQLRVLEEKLTLHTVMDEDLMV